MTHRARLTITAFVLALMMSGETWAQSKSLGVFTFSDDRPSWASFALLPDTADFAASAEQSRQTGIRWVLYFGSGPLNRYVEPTAIDAKARADAAGLTPYILATVFHEEWYGALKSGRLSQFSPLDQLDLAHPADLIRAANIVCDWVGRNHAVLRRVFAPIPVALIEGWINDDVRYGAGYYQPVPPNTDVLALEGYVWSGGSWAADVEPFLQHAVNTRTEPIALIVQGFQIDGDPLWSRGPTPESIAGTARWMQHPRVVTGWVFDYLSRPWADIRGMRDLPSRAALETALGIRPAP